MSKKKKIQLIVDRMRLLFSGHPDPSGQFTSASRELVEKWANEIEAALKEKDA